MVGQSRGHSHGHSHSDSNGHSIAGIVLVAALIAAMLSAISIELIGTRRITEFEVRAAWQLFGDPRPAAYQTFAADGQSLVRLMVDDDPPRSGGYEADPRVETAELEVGAGLARLEYDYANVTLVSSRATAADALGVVEAAVKLENVLYLRLGEVDQQQPANAPHLAAQQDDFSTAMQLETSRLAQFAVDAARDLGTR